VKFGEAGVLIRKLAFLICVLGMPCVSWAQSNPASWENLSTLQPGEKIQILEENSTKVSGTFLNVSDAAIWLQEKARQEMVQKPDVRSVTLRKNEHRLRNTLLGAAIGVGAGSAIGAATYQHQFLGRGFQAFGGAMVGVIPGTVVGAVWPSHKTMYRVQAP
jgi:hypothetical protein